MHYDVIGCVIWSKVEYLEKEIRVKQILPRKLNCGFKRSLQCDQ